MTTPRTRLLTALALACFAGNSLLCRVALRTERIDAASFTALRLISGALMLLLVLWLRDAWARAARSAGDDGGTPAEGGVSTPRHDSGSSAMATARRGGSWGAAAALFGYAAAFSFAYVSLPAGTGALLLFGAVQITMIAAGLRGGERPRVVQWLGLGVALAGLVGLVAPGIDAPPPIGALLMIGAGVAWGIYSLRGRASRDPVAATAGNFLRTAPPALALALLTVGSLRLDPFGACCAIVSGAVTSGCGYVIWYAALRGLNAVGAATVQLATPVLAAVGGILLLGEPPTLRLLLAAPAVLGGIALVVAVRRPARMSSPLPSPEPESR